MVLADGLISYSIFCKCVSLDQLAADLTTVRHRQQDQQEPGKSRTATTTTTTTTTTATAVGLRK